jgi:hypothetical protein
MKTTAVAEAMICVFSAIFEVLPTRSQRCVNSILDATLAEDVIEDANARKLLESLLAVSPGEYPALQRDGFLRDGGGAS